MVGQLGGTVGGVALTFQRAADLTVEAKSATRRQVVVESAAHEGVREGVAPDRIARGANEADALGLLQCLEDLVLAPECTEMSSDSSNSRPMTAATLRTSLGALGQARQPTADDLPHPLGQPHLGEGEIARPAAVPLDERAALDEVEQHLADEERIPLRLLVQRLREEQGRSSSSWPAAASMKAVTR